MVIAPRLEGSISGSRTISPNWPDGQGIGSSFADIADVIVLEIGFVILAIDVDSICFRIEGCIIQALFMSTEMTILVSSVRFESGPAFVEVTGGKDLGELLG
jgi:hypothetical protein